MLKQCGHPDGPHTIISDAWGGIDEALSCFQQSMHLGQEMGTLAWDLRTATLFSEAG
jgi:hypothetical protein